MRDPLRYTGALAGLALLLAAACSSGDGASTAAVAGASSSTSAPATTTTVAPTVTSAAVTTAPAGPAVAEAGGWRLVVTGPTSGSTIGAAFDLCYQLTGPAQTGAGLEVTLLSSQTLSPVGSFRMDAVVGTGSARVGLGNPDPRFYDMTVQGLLNGQPIDRLVVRIGVRFGTAAPAGCP